VAAVQAFGQPKDRGERLDGALTASPEFTIPVVVRTRLRPPMIPRDERNRLDLVGLEAAQVAVFDEVVRVLVMALEGDMHADIVKNRSIFQPVALEIAKPVYGAGFVEDRQSQPCHLIRMFRPVMVVLRELDDAATSDIGIPIDLRNLFPVPGNVIENQALAQRQIAEGQLVGAQPLQDRVEQDSPGHGEIRASRVEAGHLETLLEGQRDDLLPDSMQLFHRHAAVAQLRIGCSLVRRGDGAEAENRARRADHAVEASACDLIQVASGFRIDVFQELSLVARRERIALHESFGEANHAKLEAAAHVDIRTGASGDLDAAATDIDDHDGVARDTDAVDGGNMNQPRFLGTRDDAGANASLLGNGAQELATVFRFARGARRDRHDLVDVVGLSETDEFREDLQSRAHHLGRQSPASEASGAEANHFLLAVDDLEREVRTHADHDHVE
jgi:hypothetical protein